MNEWPQWSMHVARLCTPRSIPSHDPLIVSTSSNPACTVCGTRSIARLSSGDLHALDVRVPYLVVGERDLDFSQVTVELAAVCLRALLGLRCSLRKGSCPPPSLDKPQFQKMVFHRHGPTRQGQDCIRWATGHRPSSVSRRCLTAASELSGMADEAFSWFGSVVGV